MSIATELECLLAGEELAASTYEQLFARLLRGELGEPCAAALLTALRARGESAVAIAAALHATMACAVPFECPSGMAIVDCCGTGGDGAVTRNLSTAAALVVAAAGVPVAKHGNRSVSSRCGSADVLEALGVRIDLTPAMARACLEQVGMCFLFAPAYHPGMRALMTVRHALGIRTLFNVLGPLCNPARPKLQLVGVYDRRWCRPLAEVLRHAGRQRALVVHGGGCDELALHAPTDAVLLERDGTLRELELAPEQAGLDRAPLELLRGGDSRDNARWLADVLAGRPVAQATRDAVLLNAGATLWVAAAADDLAAGVALARDVLASGAAAEKLAELVAFTQEAA